MIEVIIFIDRITLWFWTCCNSNSFYKTCYSQAVTVRQNLYKYPWLLILFSSSLLSIKNNKLFIKIHFLIYRDYHHQESCLQIDQTSLLSQDLTLLLSEDNRSLATTSTGHWLFSSFTINPMLVFLLILH